MPRPRSTLLSIERIVEAALKLVDESGDFSFPRIARELGVSQSSLYNRIESREHIVELLRAHLFSSLPSESVADKSWQDAARTLIRSYRDRFAQHPHLVPLLVTQTVQAPEVIGMYEDLALTLERAGLPAERIGAAISTIDYFALGAALDASAPAEVWHVSEDQFPALTRAVAGSAAAPNRVADAFEFGLEILISGIETQVKQKVN
ncbi:TetR/AcrR family transcriptional regulator [Arthrobacter sp. JZ12]|uniref:TetR/AcrR family transcriptional regulator n=1 Tax=Arthrobacter sp. JZ12 TaxID=2654190 RepID=UPI002B48EDE5|nr:TetR/AcrR family transcriptional regulator C-terminal domain-containing protein [Arthrobacter sp. JZ12]WRH26020.1 TetR/AcrR family transcriptional regulator [Arthrobacter sp. JZ12]